MKGKGDLCLCLEDYMDFCCCDALHRPDFIIQQLNHIIYMHGFIRMHRRHKAEITGTLDAMELMETARSTLQESISRCAPLAVDDVTRDLYAIGWQECPVGSVRCVGLPRDNALTIVASPLAGAEEEGEEGGRADRTTTTKKARRKRKRKRAASSDHGPHRRNTLLPLVLA